MALNHVTLDDKYDLAKSRIFVTGFQAIVRLCLMQKERDRRAGLNTAGYVTGYRGSPLGGLDQQFIARAALARQIRHPLPGRHQRGPRRHRAVGLAAGRAARRGQVRRRVRHLVRQGAGRRPHRRRVPPRQFRRHLETRRRAGADGRRPHRRILDHRAPVRISLRRRDDPDPEPGRRAGDPRLRPLRLGDVALLRHLGRRSNACTRRSNRPPSSTAASTASTSSIPATTSRCREGGLNIRLRDTILGQEARLHDYKRDAMLAFVRANKLNRTSPRAGAIRRSASSPSARAISTCARRSTSSASTRSSATISASASTRSAARGRSAGTTSRSSPTASISSSWSRRSAR